jgi:glycosyltransferase involved in cell wall biosynthesis
MATRTQRVLIIGSNILGNATASRRFAEAIASIPDVEISCINVSQMDIESVPLPRFIRRYQLIPTYIVVRRMLREMARLQPNFDFIFVVTCQPLTGLHGFWPEARVAMWFDGLPHHPEKRMRDVALNMFVRILYRPAFSRVEYLMPMSNWARTQSLDFHFPAIRQVILSPTRVSRKIWENTAPLRAKPGQIIQILMVGNNAKGKGFIDFFGWCKHERKELSQFHFTIVSGERSFALREVTQGLPVTLVEDVTHSDLDRLVALYHASHLFFLPTKADMMPNVLIEAAASQLPCIASDLGAIGEVVLHNRTGWLVEPLNWSVFYEGLAAFSAQPDRFSSEALRENAMRFFDEVMQSDLEAMIFNKPPLN